MVGNFDPLKVVKRLKFIEKYFSKEDVEKSQTNETNANRSYQMNSVPNYQFGQPNYQFGQPRGYC